MPDRPYFTTKARAQRSERKVADLFKGRLQPASGALKSVHCKADVKSAHFLVDAKVTKHQTYTLRLQDWRKLRGEAFQNQRRPAMTVEFADGTLLVILAQDMLVRIQRAIEIGTI